MINSTQVTIVGNAGETPDARRTAAGTPVVSFNVAVAGRRFDRETGRWSDAGTTWYRVTAWRELAENVAATVTKGMRLVIVGALAAREFERPDGTKGTVWEITAEGMGPDLTWATAKVSRTSRDGAPVPDDPRPPAGS